MVRPDLNSTDQGARPPAWRRATAGIGGRAPLRVLHVAASVDPTFPWPVPVLRRLAAIHRSRGHRAEVATFDPPGSAWLREFPLPTYARPGLRPDSGYSRGFASWLRERCRDFDLVLVHGFRGPHVRATWRALYGTLTPYFLIPHGELRGCPLLRGVREMLGWPCVLRDATAVFFTSVAEREAADRCSRLHVDKDHVVPEWTTAAFVEALGRFGYGA
jgi:hypothetical protein